METVFTNSQLTHIWANQSQSYGKGSNMFFKGTDIYSYGHHYLAARIHIVKGKQFALVNSYNYSSTTTKHLSHIKRGLQGLMPYFKVSDVRDLKKSMAELDKNAQDTIDHYLKTMQVKDKVSIEYIFESIELTFKEASELRNMLGKKSIHPSKKQLNAVKKHLEARLARYHELNTPEVLAKKAAEKAKREARKQAKEREKQIDLINRFRAGETLNINSLDFEMLQVKNDEVITSRGARVPLKEAIMLYKAVEQGKNVVGQTVGSFTVNYIDTRENDTLVTIGCHRILLSEARQVLSNIKPKLSLVS